MPYLAPATTDVLTLKGSKAWTTLESSITCTCIIPTYYVPAQQKVSLNLALVARPPLGRMLPSETVLASLTTVIRQIPGDKGETGLLTVVLTS